MMGMGVWREVYTPSSSGSWLEAATKLELQDEEGTGPLSFDRAFCFWPALP